MSSVPQSSSLDYTRGLVGRLIQHNFVPIPLRASNDPQLRKAPRATNWQLRYFDPTDWQSGEGIGLRTGLQVDGSYLYVIDLDHHPENGVDAQVELERILSAVPDLRDRFVLCRSTSGRGRYIIFRATEGIGKRPLKHDSRRIGDFLGDGAQVVLPTPDRTFQGDLRHVPVLSDDEFAAVLDVLGMMEPEPSALPISSPIAPCADRLRPGDDFNRRGNLEPALNAAGWKLCYRRGRVSYWRRPGKESGISATLGYRDGLFHVFSTNATPFESDRSYQLFSAYVLLAHGGDVYAAARELGKQGYGEQRLSATPKSRRALEFEDLTAHLEAEVVSKNKVMLTQQQIADHFGVSVRTIQRMEVELERRGYGRRVTSSDRRTSWYEIAENSGDSNAHTYTYSQPTPHVDTPREAAGPPADQPCSTCGTPGMVVDPSGAWACDTCQTTLDEYKLITDALDAYDGLRGGGAKRDAICRYVWSNGRPDLSVDTLDELIPRVAALRRDIRRQKALRVKLVAMSDKRLRRHIRGLEAKQSNLKDGGEYKAARGIGLLLSIAYDEWERREAMRTRVLPPVLAALECVR